MKQILTLAGVLCLALLVRAEVFSIPDIGVRFDAPPTFTRVTPQEISTKFPSDRPPAFVVGNESRTTTIAYDWKADQIQPDKLNDAVASLTTAFERVVPGLEWINRKIIKIHGQKWIYLEMTSKADETLIHNMMLMTPLKGKMLMFNFNSTQNEFSTIETELRKSVASITIEHP